MDVLVQSLERLQDDVVLHGILLNDGDGLLHRLLKACYHAPRLRGANAVVLPQILDLAVDHEVQHPTVRRLQPRAAVNGVGVHGEAVEVQVEDVPDGAHDVRDAFEVVPASSDGRERRSRAVPRQLLDDPLRHVGLLLCEGVASGAPVDKEGLLAHGQHVVGGHILAGGGHGPGKILDVIRDEFVVPDHLLGDDLRQRGEHGAIRRRVVLLPARALLGQGMR
mmetsp:Transcript_74642/g.215666  ORF Transcript_74642/g.215666 Transcript_74642/m.215666 type:complete len:222 (-) Transcript_74642:695-1360(-)